MPDPAKYGTPPHPPGLRRSLGLPLMVFYGLGIIVGAGVYVVVGDVAEQAGRWAVYSFLIAGGVATLTALSYAELGARFPEAAGAAAYVNEAFHSGRFSQATGLAVAVVALVSAATIASGTAGYARAFVDLPDTAIGAALVVLFTAVACLGVKNSVRAAAVMTIIELAGLFLVIVAGAGLAQPDRAPFEFVPDGLSAWQGILAGAFLAFFAFTGFENLANMAEETTNVGKTLPRAILGSLAISTLLYVAVAAVVVASGPGPEASHTAPLLSIIERRGWGIGDAFAAVALLAVSNGVLIQILMLSRLFYGMADRKLLPSWLARVDAKQVPVRATLTAGGLALLSTTTLPFDSLLRLSTTITLIVFALVTLSLWRLKRTAPRADLEFAVPGWVPVLGTLGNLCLITVQFGTL